jgi:hypothetical protein
MVASPRNANEDRRLVDARRDKVLASGRTEPELDQFIAKAGRNHAHWHATTL